MIGSTTQSCQGATSVLLQFFVEGNGVRATARMTDCSLVTVLKLLADLGCTRAGYHNHVHVLQFLPSPSDLRVTPEMEAGIADHIWTLDELVGLLEAPNSTAV